MVLFKMIIGILLVYGIVKLKIWLDDPNNHETVSNWISDNIGGSDASNSGGDSSSSDCSGGDCGGGGGGGD